MSFEYIVMIIVVSSICGVFGEFIFSYFWDKGNITCVVCNKNLGRFFNKKYNAKDWQSLHTTNPPKPFRSDDVICKSCFKEIAKKIRVSIGQQIFFVSLCPIAFLVLIGVGSITEGSSIQSNPMFLKFIVLPILVFGIYSIYSAFNRIEKIRNFLVLCSITMISFILGFFVSSLDDYDRTIMLPFLIPGFATYPLYYYFIIIWSKKWNKIIDKVN